VPIQWTRKQPGEIWSGTAGPFLLKVEPKGDGRWTWHVFTDNAQNPTATGVASSLGGAKNVIEQFVKRSGRA
jgi:hypothetical protein